MKVLSKVSLLVVALIVSVAAQAQMPVQFGVKAGVNLSNFTGDLDDTKAKVGYNVGVTAEYAITSAFYLQSGLELTTKGAKYDIVASLDGADAVGKITANAMYLQLPVHAAYKVPVTEGVTLVFHAGPYVAYGIGGKVKTKVLNTETKTDFFGDEEEGGVKRFDFGLGLGVGAEFGKITANLGYDHGLTNLSRVDALKVRNMNASLSLGYKF